jgi:hypothetical protein
MEAEVGHLTRITAFVGEQSVEAWLALLLPLIPPLVLAARRPHTEKWRRARKRFWITLPFGIAIAAASLAFINFLGPAAIWLGALLTLMILAVIMGVALATIRNERNEWCEQHKGKETVVGVPGIDPTKPWKM